MTTGYEEAGALFYGNSDHDTTTDTNEEATQIDEAKRAMTWEVPEDASPEDKLYGEHADAQEPDSPPLAERYYTGMKEPVTELFLDDMDVDPTDAWVDMANVAHDLGINDTEAAKVIDEMTVGHRQPLSEEEWMAMDRQTTRDFNAMPEHQRNDIAFGWDLVNKQVGPQWAEHMLRTGAFHKNLDLLADIAYRHRNRNVG